MKDWLKEYLKDKFNVYTLLVYIFSLYFLLRGVYNVFLYIFDVVGLSDVSCIPNELRYYSEAKLYLIMLGFYGFWSAFRIYNQNKNSIYVLFYAILAILSFPVTLSYLQWNPNIPLVLLILITVLLYRQQIFSYLKSNIIEKINVPKLLMYLIVINILLLMFFLFLDMYDGAVFSLLVMVILSFAKLLLQK